MFKFNSVKKKISAVCADKMLVIAPSWVGDTIMAQSLFKLLRLQNPELIIDVLAPEWCHPLLERMPEVSSALISPFKHGDLKIWQRYQFAKQFRHQGYGHCIVLPNSFKSALIPFFAKISLRTGWLGECRWILLNDIHYLTKDLKKKYSLMVQRYLALGTQKFDSTITKDLYPALITSAKQQQIVRDKFGLKDLAANASSSKILALCPGAEFGPAKRWPENYFAELAKQKLKDGWKVWLFGSAKDKIITDKIIQMTDHACIDFAGKTTLGEAIDLLSMTHLVVSNDSGLMHVAAALQKPIIAIYGPTSAAYTPPLSDNAKIITSNLNCQPCFQRECPLKHQKCMTELMPQMVLKVMEQYV